MKYQKKPLFIREYRWYLRKILPKSVYLRYLSRHENLSLLIWQLLASKVSDGFSIIDIGAFHGEFALIARNVNSNSEIFAFEPNPQSLCTLKSNCLDKQINIVEKVVCNKAKEVFFYCDSMISSIVESDTNKNSIKLFSITLDSWIKEQKNKPKLIKIDVEDAASQVFEGSTDILRKFRPTVLCEILNDKVGEQVQKLLSYNYNFYYINENFGLEQKKEIKRFDWRYKNWLFVPTDDKSKIELLKSNNVKVISSSNLS